MKRMFLGDVGKGGSFFILGMTGGRCEGVKKAKLLLEVGIRRPKGKGKRGRKGGVKDEGMPRKQLGGAGSESGRLQSQENHK